MQILVILTTDNFNEIKSIKNSITRYKKQFDINFNKYRYIIYYFNNEQIKSNNNLIVQRKKFKLTNNYEIHRRIFLRSNLHNRY